MNNTQLQNLANAGSFLSGLYNPTQFSKREIVTVSGVQEAVNFKLDKGESIALIDANEDVLYIKDCDEIGKCNLKIYQCVDKTDELLNSSNRNSFDKSEIDQMKNDLAEIKSLLSRGVHNEYNAKKENRQQ